MTTLKMPQFWYSTHFQTKSKAVSLALWPLSYLYRFACLIHRAATIQYRSRLPVICIGNLTMGGGGKTPTSRALMDLIKQHGRFKSPCFLMRGYGGNASGPIEVDLSTHTAWDVGDEALMQARYAPVIVARNRRQGAKLAEQRGYDVIIMDDGFQNFSLHKNLSIIVIDGGFGFGNGLCFPAGPLREPVSDAARRAHAALIINPDEDLDTRPLGSLRKFTARLELMHQKDQPMEPDNRNVVAFAGIARPEKFFTTLENAGYTIQSRFGYPDHHVYTHDQLKQMHSRAEKNGAALVTTEKDWVRLADSWRKKAGYLKIVIDCDDAFETFFAKVLDRF